MAVATELVRIVDGKLVPAPGVWEFDVGHTEVGFEGRHLKVNRVRGRFARFSGHLVVADVPEESTALLEIEAASVESGFKDRDDHLRSADWFDIERHPIITFRSNQISHVSGSHWSASGELTVKGITRPVEVSVDFGGATTDPWGNAKIGAVVKAEVDREEWGLTWNMPLGAGGFVVDRTVWLRIDAEAVLKVPALGGR